MILPTAVEEARSWAMLENAWATLGPGPNEVRRALAKRDVTAEAFEEAAELEGHLPAVLRALVEASAGLSAEELTALDRVAERKLYEIDRADVQAVTDGSDDGFLTRAVSPSSSARSSTRPWPAIRASRCRTPRARRSATSSHDCTPRGSGTSRTRGRGSPGHRSRTRRGGRGSG